MGKIITKRIYEVKGNPNNRIQSISRPQPKGSVEVKDCSNCSNRSSRLILPLEINPCLKCKNLNGWKPRIEV